MQRIQNIFHWTLLSTLLGHVLCCGLPTVVSALSLMSGLGVMASMPTGLNALHGVIHAYEAQLLIFSGAMVAFGWILHEISRRIDCHDTGCHHPPCEPKKTRSSKVLMFATVLFAVNVFIYVGIGHEASAHDDHHDQHVSDIY